MSGRSSFVLYISQRKHLKLLNREQKGDLLDAIFAHAAGEDPPEVDGMTMMALSFISDQMDRDHEKYLETSRKRSEAGKMGGRPKATTSTNKQPEANKANGFSDKQTETKKPDNDTDNDNVNDTDKNIYGVRFESVWSVYPRKDEKKSAYKCYQARLKEGFSEDELETAVKRYADECKAAKKEKQYIKQAKTFLGVNTPFVDYLKVEEGDRGSEQRTGTDEGGLASEAIAAGVSTEFEGW